MAPITMVSERRVGSTPFLISCSSVASSFFVVVSVKCVGGHKMTNVV